MVIEKAKDCVGISNCNKGAFAKFRSNKVT